MRTRASTPRGLVGKKDLRAAPAQAGRRGGGSLAIPAGSGDELTGLHWPCSRAAPNSLCCGCVTSLAEGRPQVVAIGRDNRHITHRGIRSRRCSRLHESVVGVSTAAVVLAAGGGSRFAGAQHKLLAPVPGSAPVPLGRGRGAGRGPRRDDRRHRRGRAGSARWRDAAPQRPMGRRADHVAAPRRGASRGRGPRGDRRRARRPAPHPRRGVAPGRRHRRDAHRRRHLRRPSPQPRPPGRRRLVPAPDDRRRGRAIVAPSIAPNS